jgi:hypothetical protein
MVPKRKCPKCGSTPTSYLEMWTAHGIQFDADDQGVPDAEGYMVDGNPDYVQANCDCGHSWRLRGISQITELRPQ